MLLIAHPVISLLGVQTSILSQFVFQELKLLPASRSTRC